MDGPPPAASTRTTSWRRTVPKSGLIRAAASAPDSTSQVSNCLAVLAELSVADLRLEWRRLFRADPPRLSRDIMMRAVAYRLQESMARVQSDAAD